MITLKHEAKVFLVQFHAILLGELVNGVVDQVVLARPGAVMHSEKMEQSGFACARRPHDGDEFSLLDLEIDAAQDEGLGRAMFKIFFDVPQNDHWQAHNDTLIVCE